MNRVVKVIIQLLILSVAVLFLARKLSYVFPYSHCKYVALDHVYSECLQHVCIYLLYISVFSVSKDSGKPFDGVAMTVVSLHVLLPVVM